MKRRPPPKLLGEQAECAFMHQALQRGFTVSVPFGGKAPYDLLLHLDPCAPRSPLWKVQVRAVNTSRDGRSWRVHLSHFLHGSRRPLEPHIADFVAAWIVPLDLWYILPVRAFAPRWFLVLHPGAGQNMWERYRDAWGLLRRSRF